MYQSFRIKNFRGFRDLTLDSLERINLIAGKNNVGKTALLEAIFLHLRPDEPDLGSSRFPELSVSAREFEFSRLRPNRTRWSMEDIWSSLFFNYDTSKPIELLGRYDQQDRTLTVSIAEAGITQPALFNDETLSSVIPDQELRFDYYISPLQPFSSVSIIDGRLRRHTKPIKSAESIFLSTSSRSPREDAVNFSKLEMTGRQQEIISTLALLEPRLSRLAVLVTGRDPVIHGDIGIGRLIPIPIMGEGMGRLLSIALAIANAEHGAVLIDEVENGLHYSVMSKVWEAIGLAARQADVQVFATTHSWECIRAAHEAFSASQQYDFRLHRLDRTGEDITAVTFDQEMLDTALQTGLEVR